MLLAPELVVALSWVPGQQLVLWLLAAKLMAVPAGAATPVLEAELEVEAAEVAASNW